MTRKLQAGKRYGKLLVLEDLPTEGYIKSCLCKCDCGRILKVRSGNLSSGNSTQCLSCKSTEIATTHGGSKLPEYKTWKRMFTRCRIHPHYLKNKISVHPIWNDFQRFLKDMGPKPTPTHTLDRIDGTKNYSPANCRWATWKEQGNNTSRNKFITAFGEKKTLANWARDPRCAVTRGILTHRIQRGIEPEIAISCLKIEEITRGADGRFNGMVRLPQFEEAE